MRGTRRSWILAAILVAASVCSTGCCAPAVSTDGWKPHWMEAPPRPDVDLVIEPMRCAGARQVSLAWRLEEGQGFGYDVRNRIRIVPQAGKSAPGETQTQGSLVFRPLAGGRAEVRMSTHLVSGAGSPTVRIFTMGPDGMLEDPDPRVRSMLQLVFPVIEGPLATGESVERQETIPDGKGVAETRTRSVVGIVGWATVDGRKCAIVALDHEARIWALEQDSQQFQDTGSVTRLQLMGYFDIKVWRYVAVAISEVSVMVHDAGQTRTERSATYVEKGLAGS